MGGGACDAVHRLRGRGLRRPLRILERALLFLAGNSDLGRRCGGRGSPRCGTSVRRVSRERRYRAAVGADHHVRADDQHRGAIQLVTSNEQAFGRDNRSTSALDIAEAGLPPARRNRRRRTRRRRSEQRHARQWHLVVPAARTQDIRATRPSSRGRSPRPGCSRRRRTSSRRRSRRRSSADQSQTQTTDSGFRRLRIRVFLGAGLAPIARPSRADAEHRTALNVNASTYIAGSLCLSGARVHAGALDKQRRHLSLYVGGKLMTSNEAAGVGTTTKHIGSATIVGGCIDGNHTTGSKKNNNLAYAAVPCSQQGTPLTCVTCSGYGSAVYANNYSSTQNTLTKPTLDPNWYSNAKPGPLYGCNNSPTVPANQSTYPTGWNATTFDQKILDNDTTRNTSLPASPRSRRTRSISPSSSTDRGAVMRRTASTAVTTTRAAT